MIRVGTMPEKERLFMAFIDGSQMVPCNKRGAKGTMERVDVESTRECANAKAKQDKTKKDAVDRLEAKIFKYDLLENKVLFVRLDEDDRFPSELNGLVAMQLAAKYKKPTIVARLNDQGYNRGSARGMNQSELRDFREFLLSTGMFEYAQGHANAFGISIPDSRLRAFHELANEALKDIDFGENVYDVNFVRGADASDLYDLVVDLASQNGIWGQGSPEPVVCVEEISCSPRDVRIMGSNQDTLKIEYNGMSYLKFRATDMINELKSYPADAQLKLSVVGRCNLNEWMGRKTPQLFIDDYEIKNI
jgi:single-stranded-DNA-specific exonuclease